MKWQVVASHDGRGEEIKGKWEISDSEGNLITNDEALLHEVVAQRIVDAHNRIVEGTQPVPMPSPSDGPGGPNTHKATV